MAEFLSRCYQAAEFLHDLSPAERGVLDLIGFGLTNRQLSEQLHISELTARTHVKRIHSKLAVEERTLLVAISHQWLVSRSG